MMRVVKYSALNEVRKGGLAKTDTQGIAVAQLIELIKALIIFSRFCWLKKESLAFDQ